MNMLRLVKVLLLAGLIIPAPALAQTPEVGQRIRVTAPEVLTERRVGQLLWLDSDSLVLAGADTAPPERWVVPPEAITRLEVFEGRRGHAGRGLLIGAGTGLALGLIGISGDGTCSGSGNYGELCALVVTGTTLGGGVLGLLIGAVVRTDRWNSIPVGL
ncbi:MAG: hypothetical protein HKN73_14895 [Gemmatimonadetes bacterium]|nr:hypothetical protein [Gemmatimonadota bacterium]